MGERGTIRKCMSFKLKEPRPKFTGLKWCCFKIISCIVGVFSLYLFQLQFTNDLYLLYTLWIVQLPL